MPVAMGRVQRVGDLDRRVAAPGRAAARHGAGAIGQRLALEILHDQEVERLAGDRRAYAFAADVVQRADVRMAQAPPPPGPRARSAREVGLAGVGAAAAP